MSACALRSCPGRAPRAAPQPRPRCPCGGCLREGWAWGGKTLHHPNPAANPGSRARRQARSGSCRCAACSTASATCPTAESWPGRSSWTRPATSRRRPPPPPIPPRRPWRRVPINYHNPNPILLHRVSLPAGFGHPPARPGQVALDAVGLPEGAPAAAAPHGAATVPARLPPRGRAGRCGAFVRAHAQAHNRCACVPASIRSGRPTQRSWPALR